MLRKKDRERMITSVDDLGELLENWRINVARVSKTEAARRCGITPQHWWLLANNQRPNLSGETIDKLSSGTGIAVEILLTASHRTRSKMNERLLMPATV